jgi:DNA polymerase
LKDAVKKKGRAVGMSSKKVYPTAPKREAIVAAPRATVAPTVMEKSIRPATPPVSTAIKTAVPAVTETPAAGTGLFGEPALPNGQDYVSDPALSPSEKLRRLRVEELGDCQRCPLGAGRIKLAFGVGNPAAKIMFIGEGPGYQEDRQGEPFVGPAGKLLDKILEATGLSRQPTTPEWNWIYIANMVKCHPMIDPSDNTKRGNDRPPTPEEMLVCSPYLMKQIRIIRPLFIVALGATAGKGLLKTEKGISTFRGQWADWSPDGEPGLIIRLLPTYHPAALLRNPALKKDVWEDMKMLRAELTKSVGAS